MNGNFSLEEALFHQLTFDEVIYPKASNLLTERQKSFFLKLFLCIYVQLIDFFYFYKCENMKNLYYS